jgi:hypothetical protein
LTGCACLGQAKSCNNAKGQTIWIADAHRGDGKRFMCGQMRNGLHFWNWKGPFVSTYGANNANHNRRDGGKRFVVHADEKLAAFLELKSVIRASGDCA